VTFSPQVVVSVISALNDLGQPYILTGSLARNLYCIPRSTVDADFVVSATPEMLEYLFAQLGQQFDRESQMTFETVTGKTHHKFRHPKTKFLIEIFEADMDDPHERSRFERRQEVDVEGYATFVPAAEDIIVQKLRWYSRISRTKDRTDALEVMEAQWHALDWPYIERWAHEHSTVEMFNELRGEVRTQLEQ